MIDLFLAMIQDGSISQGMGGMHVFDLFDNTNMRQKGGKRKFTSEEGSGSNVDTELQNFDSRFGLQGSSDSESIEVENLHGGLELKITIHDHSGSKEFLANIDIDNNSDQLSINFTSQISPHDSLRVTRQVYRMNNQLQKQAIEEKYSISNKKDLGASHFRDLADAQGHDDDLHSGHHFQDLVKGQEHDDLHSGHHFQDLIKKKSADDDHCDHDDDHSDHSGGGSGR